MSKVASDDQGWEISFDDVDEDEEDDQRHEGPSPGGVSDR